MHTPTQMKSKHFVEVKALNITIHKHTAPTYVATAEDVTMRLPYTLPIILCVC